MGDGGDEKEWEKWCWRTTATGKRWGKGAIAVGDGVDGKRGGGEQWRRGTTATGKGWGKEAMTMGDGGDGKRVGWW
eukprot:4500043-Pleurochrysis_carterae.AAC.1